HEKTMVVFSGDLDKTIAACIMANGAAALGRPVTIFFNFWGLNVLRRPEKVRVKKNLIETAFGLMMPRGTKKLGLSRMNMGGAGALMIRWIMKQNGISSLEELIDDAIKHGVRLVACQMSMDIMGIKQEELIDGIELGGVATMLGSAEKSDMTYFI
ncbi:MAG: DsrE/DsrF/DrsH-like family protein, partial [Clostridia bacterium]|nr:DsrE/DsrF/DrsH-like family protein [Clostridia bacterium]